MLTLTESAQDIVRRIPQQPTLPSSAGLRIFRRGGAAATDPLEVATEYEPREGDEVVDHDGARVFVGPRAVDSLRDKTLDATTDDRGRIQFSVVAAD